MQAHCPRANQITEETMHSKEIQDEERQNHVRINIVKPKVINYVNYVLRHHPHHLLSPGHIKNFIAFPVFALKNSP